MPGYRRSLPNDPQGELHVQYADAFIETHDRGAARRIRTYASRIRTWGTPAEDRSDPLDQSSSIVREQSPHALPMAGNGRKPG